MLAQERERQLWFQTVLPVVYTSIFLPHLYRERKSIKQHGYYSLTKMLTEEDKSIFQMRNQIHVNLFHGNWSYSSQYVISTDDSASPLHSTESFSTTSDPGCPYKLKATKTHSLMSKGGPLLLGPEPGSKPRSRSKLKLDLSLTLLQHTVAFSLGLSLLEILMQLFLL